MAAPAPAVSVDAAAFVPHLDPTGMPHMLKSDVPGTVRLLVTVGPDGNVLSAEAISGPEALRPLAVEEARGYKYRPVRRDGHPVVAITEAYVHSMPEGKLPVNPDVSEQVAASQRIAALEQQFPRTPEQALADLEQDAGEDRKAFYAADLAKAALAAGDLAKAESYAQLALAEKSDSNDDWNLGNRIHYGHIVLGRVAVRRDNLGQARDHLLAAGKTNGSPQLDSFGPDFALARELLEKGEKGAVLVYLDEVRVFWKMGGGRLDSWTKDIQSGKIPSF